MDKTIIAEGRTTNEAIENGLKQLRVSKDKVDIFFTFYSDILEYRNLLKSQVEFSNQEISSRLKYNYIQQRKYFNYKQGTKEDEER